MMGDFSSLAILFLIITLLAIILIYLQQDDEYFKDFNINSFNNINNNNNSNNYYFQGKSPYVSFLKEKDNKFIGINKWKQQYQKGNCIKYQKFPYPFKKYIDNTSLKYDGLWRKKNKGRYYTWNLK